MTAMDATATDRPLGAAQAHQWIEGMLEVVQRLSTLLATEIDAVRERTPQRVADLAAEKEYLALTYSDQVKALKSNPGMLAKAEESRLGRLRGAIDGFRRVVNENARVLGTAKTANERFIKAVSEAVSERTRPAVTYSKSGVLGLTSRGSAGGLSIALDQSV